jgi:O-antigen/teichoic acid export membrane protein
MRRASLIQLSWRVAGGAFALGAAAFTSLGLGLSTQGVVASSLAVLIALSVVTGAGLSPAVAYHVALRPTAGRAIVSRAVLIGVGLASGAGALLVFLTSLALPALPISWWPVAIALPLCLAGQLGLGAAQGLGLRREYNIAYVAQPLTQFAVAVIAVVVGASSSDMPMWSSVLIVVPYAIQAIAVLPVWRSLASADASHGTRELIEYTRGIYPNAVLHFLSYRLDLLIVAALLGATAAGLYSLALNAVDAVARLGQSFATVLFPEFVRSAAAALIARRVALGTGVASMTVLGFVALALGLAAGASDELRRLSALVGFLAVAGGAVNAWTILASFLAARKRLSDALRVNVVLVVTSVVLYLALIPTLGLNGGAIGTSVGLLVAAILGYRAVVVTAPSRPVAIDESLTRFKNPLGK